MPLVVPVFDGPAATIFASPIEAGDLVGGRVPELRRSSACLPRQPRGCRRQPGQNEDTYKRGRIWYARVAGDRMVPVRMEYDTAFGVVKGYLAELRGRGASVHLAGE